jgi:phenylacetate 2-hydroxylase
MCNGSHLAYREMSITFVRMVIAFEVLPAIDPAQRPILTGPLAGNANPSGLSIEPKAFKIGFRVRDRACLEKWLEQSAAATKHIES